MLLHRTRAGTVPDVEVLLYRTRAGTVPDVEELLYRTRAGTVPDVEVLAQGLLAGGEGFIELEECCVNEVGKNFADRAFSRNSACIGRGYEQENKPRGICRGPQAGLERAKVPEDFGRCIVLGVRMEDQGIRRRDDRRALTVVLCRIGQLDPKRPSDNAPTAPQLHACGV